jgi:AcrR family transcriptional regulator
MPADASKTRKRLIDAAARSFAEDGVFKASLIEITRQAGQRNRGALHYHFGSRLGVLAAVLEGPVGFLSRREGDLLEVALASPEDDLRSVVAAIVRPAAELAESGWRGRCYLVILAQLVEEDPSSLGKEVNDVLAQTGGHAVYDLLERRMGDFSAEVRIERVSLATSFILRSVADRARALGRRARAGRPQLDHEAFVDNLIAMVSGAISQPLKERA